MVGNPTFWTAPVATATLGAEAAVFIIAYDMLTQARIALMVRFLRAGAPKEQSARTAIADYAPTIGAITGLAIGFAAPGAGRRRPPRGRPRHRDGLHRLPAAGRLLAEALDRQAAGGDDGPRARGAPDDRARRCSGSRRWPGVDLPPAVWLLALGPIPTSVVSFAQVYGYSPKTAATGLAISISVAIALLPISLALAG